MNRYELKFIWFNSLHLHAFVPIFDTFVPHSTLMQDKQNLGAHNDVLKKTPFFGTVLLVRFEPWPQCRYHRTSDLWIVLGPSIPATPTVLGWWMLLPNKGFKWKWMIWLFPKMPEKWWFIGMYYTIDDNSLIPWSLVSWDGETTSQRWIVDTY